MLVILPSNSEPPKCPKCNKAEKKIETCKNCGYVYEKEEAPSFLMVLSFIFVLWIIISLSWWLITSETNILFDVFVSQLNWLKSLRIF